MKKRLRVWSLGPVLLGMLIMGNAPVQAQSSPSSLPEIISLLLIDEDEDESIELVEIAAGNNHSCARLSDDTVKCWGDYGTGQLGDGTTVPRLTPVIVH